MTTLSDSVMDNNYSYYYEARARDVNLESITSSERNELILEKLRNNDASFKEMSIVGTDYDESKTDDDFDVQEGDDLGWLGYFIGQSTRLESLFVHHLPGDRSFRQGLSQNQSIQELYILRDLGKAGFQSLAPFLQNTNTLEELHLSMSFEFTSFECAQNVALLLSLCQIKSLKRLAFDENGLSGEGFEAIARALRAQPQLEELNLYNISREDAHFDQRGYAALGATMKNWTSPSLNKLCIYQSDLNDEGLLALVEGMTNCVNLKHLDLSGNRSGPITVVGSRALSSLFQSKKFCLQSLDLSRMSIDNEGMVALASRLAAFQSLESLNLSNNAMGDEGLKALAVGLSNKNNLESLNLGSNGPFSAIGLRHLSDYVIPTAMNLKELSLGGNAINDEGMQALAIGLRKNLTLERLYLSSNAIGSEGLRALAAAEISTLLWLQLANNAINDEALGVLVGGIGNFISLETLDLSHNNMITSSGLDVLANIFQCTSCPLKEIHLYPTNIGDSVAQAFAEGLLGNQSLTKLCFGYRNVTALGWAALSTLLCDTSSVNNIYHSNHTLKVIGRGYFTTLDDIPSSFERYLELNRQNNQYDVPICKILMSHSDLDMTPLLQWKLKLLPFLVAWFERAQSCRTYLEESITSFERRELSALYQFIHGLPLLAASGFYKQMSTEAHSKKRKFDHCDK